MDSHQMALWCWSKCKQFGTSNILHIDHHYDSRGISIEEASYDDITSIPESHLDYLAIDMDVPGYSRIPQISWDNFLSVYLKKFRKGGRVCYLTGETWGDKPSDQEVEFWDNEHRDNLIDQELRDGESWIVDIDIDYFFDRIEEEFIDWPVERIKKTAEILKQKQDAGIISVMTIALSPNCCGGLEASKRVLQIFCEELDVAFPLSSLWERED